VEVSRHAPRSCEDSGGTRARPRSLASSAVALTILLSGCGFAVEPTNQVESEIVYDADDRREYFEIDEAEVRARTGSSVVALVSREWLRWRGQDVLIDAPSWGEVSDLCPSERFADQPAAAFCSGVLVDWDLVLTAGHCLRLLSLDDFVVVFGYYYAAPEALTIRDSDVIEPSEIVSEALDPPTVEPRLDYGWLRLSRLARSPRAPAALRLGQNALAVGDRIVSAGTSGGLPLKIDTGATVRGVRAQLDYFVADADTTMGASGGAAFDRDWALAGVLARGGQDLSRTEAGCKVTVREQGAAAAEQFTLAHAALEMLCAGDTTRSSLCRSDCDDPCTALPAPQAPAPEAPGGGCSLGTGTAGSGVMWCVVAPLLAFVIRRRRSSVCAF
jgi:hypothetical protein